MRKVMYGLKVDKELKERYNKFIKLGLIGRKAMVMYMIGCFERGLNLAEDDYYKHTHKFAEGLTLMIDVNENYNSIGIATESGALTLNNSHDSASTEKIAAEGSTLEAQKVI